MQVRYFSCQDIATMTGKKLKTVWGWCNSGKLRASRPGGRDYVISEADFLEFMASDNRRNAKKKVGKERRETHEQRDNE